jgi:hypothetical protein
MTNSWSFLFDELNMTKHSKYYYDYDRNDPNRENPFKKSVELKYGKEPYFEGRDSEGRYHPDNPNQAFWHEDGNEFIGNPYSSDTINFTSTSYGAAQEVPMIFGDSGQDCISFDYNKDFHLNLAMPQKQNNNYKYSEEKILKELSEYINGTYNQHYSAGDDKIQTLDLIEACGDGEAFCRSNILKYASRYDKKGTARRDIMKILHYAVLLMHFNDKNAQRETYPQ